MEILAFFLAFLAGIYGTTFFGSWINLPEAGPVLAVCVMGTFILWAVRHPGKKP